MPVLAEVILSSYKVLISQTFVNTNCNNNNNNNNSQKKKNEMSHNPGMVMKTLLLL